MNVESNWNEESHKDMMIKGASQFIDTITKADVRFYYEDFDNPKLNNIVFWLVGKEKEPIKMSHHSFYKYSGMVCDPEFWFMRVILPIVFKRLGIVIPKGRKR